MSVTLNAFIKNKLEDLHDLFPDFKGTVDHRIHGYIYVYDASNRNTFETLECLIETVKEIEKSERRGKKTVLYTPLKMIVGNKKDLLSKRVSMLNSIDKDKF